MKSLEFILEKLAVGCTLVFLLASAIMVLGQAASVLILNGMFSVSIYNAICKPAGVVAAVTTVISLLLAYLRGQMKG